MSDEGELHAKTFYLIILAAIAVLIGVLGIIGWMLS